MNLLGIAAPATTFLLLVAVGIELTAEDFVRVRRQWGLVTVAVLSPLILLPPIALALTYAFEAGPDIASGVLLIAACPIGGVSNTYSYLARASTALSVTLTGLSCLCATLTIPLVSAALELALARPLGIQVPLSVLAVQLFGVLALPVAIGMWARKHRPALALRHAPLLQRLALFGIAIVLLLVIVGDPDAFARGLQTAVPLAAVFVIASVVVGWITAALVTPDHRDRFTIAAEFGTRNIAVATAIAVTILGRVEFARFATTYALTEVPLLLGAVALFRKYQARRPA
jgi:BASS family bile acid:Na+ symporter